MLPETDFYRRGHIMSLMFLIIGSRYYNTENSNLTNRDYLNLCGVRFPLKKGRSLLKEEQRYMQKNKKQLEQYKDEIEKKINQDGIGIAELHQDIVKQEEILFFLSKICSAYESPTTLKYQRQSQQSPQQEKESILMQIIGEDCAVINRRLYPLKQVGAPLFINIEEKNYTLCPSHIEVHTIEALFQKKLTEKLKIEVLKNSEKLKGLEEYSQELQSEIYSLEIFLKIKRYSHCYELQDLGYDSSIRSVYWLIPPHNNITTNKSYKEGQSAMTLPLNGEELGTSARFAERQDRNSPFRLVQNSHCLGFSLVGDSFEDKMAYLRKAAHNVYRNKSFHE
jgi:hypothetical protein